RAETPQPGDKLELLPRPGEAALWSAASETLTGPNCQSFPVPVTPPDPVFPVFRATIQPPAAVAGPVTRFVVDDLVLSSLGDWLFALVKTGNLFPHGDMEDVGLTAADWSAATPCEIIGAPLPASYFTGPGCGPSASALLLTRQTGAATVVTLTQNVTFPSAGEEIRFKLRVGQPGGPENTFKVEAGGDVLLDTDASDASLGAWKEFIVPYIPAWRNTSRVLRFSAQIADGPAPASFLLDDVCIGQPPAGPVLSVSNASLRLENLTVSTGSEGVSVDDGALLAFVRCATENISGPGLHFTGSATGTASNAVFTGCSGPAVLSDSTGLVTVYQCTVKGNGGGIEATSGRINLAASIIESGAVAGEVHTWLNLIRGGFPAAYEQAGFENLDPGTTVNYLDSPWIGKLDGLSPVLSGHMIAAIDEVTGLVAAADRAADFEKDPRSAEGEELQVGADQVGGTLSAPMWISCSVSPAVVGRGEPVTITVVTQGMDLGLARLRIVPEEPLAGMTEVADVTIPTQCYEIPLAADGENTATATVTFSEPCNFRSVMNTPLCTEGINRVYLNDGTNLADPVLYGHGMPGPTDQGAGDCSFLVDTTPPTLLWSASADGDAATAQPR
ncbi:MAG TPA: right-handed parallel beta-helix repeat-containing protein, partial [Candidatus Hydrogenedentes bacterium]|nr:right-handed parallel beta-helix repeat-containing protein [Candidatus Hydrogenedentota bacterium]